jgi:hypothetical protein
MARLGLNCSMTYNDGTSTRGYKVRCRAISLGYEMVGEESQAKDSRAFYPHQTAPTQFSITVDVIGLAERRSLNAYLMGYAAFILDPGLKTKITPTVTVTVPIRKFTREGVPVSGVAYGTELGAMMWSPTIVFETSRETIDWNETFDFSVVSADQAGVNEPESKYYYPTGIQLSGNKGPAVQAAVNGDPLVHPNQVVVDPTPSRMVDPGTDLGYQQVGQSIDTGV